MWAEVACWRWAMSGVRFWIQRPDSRWWENAWGRITTPLRWARCTSFSFPLMFYKSAKIEIKLRKCQIEKKPVRIKPHFPLVNPSRSSRRVQGGRRGRGWLVHRQGVRLVSSWTQCERRSFLDPVGAWRAGIWAVWGSWLGMKGKRVTTPLRRTRWFAKIKLK